MGVRTIGRFTNSTTTAYTASSNITFTNNTVSSTAITSNSDGGILLKEPGTYLVVGNFTAVATAADTDVSIQILQNGTAANGTIGTTTLTAIGDSGNISIIDLVTIQSAYNNSYATISFEMINAASLSNSNVIILRVI